MGLLILCDRCGREVGPHQARYRAVLEIVHDVDTLVLTEEDLARDHAKEIRELLKEMERVDPRELEEQVYVKRSLRVCATCRKTLLRAATRVPSAPGLAGGASPKSGRRRGRRRPRPR